MFEILAMIIFVIVQARLTLNDYKWLVMTANDYEKWIRQQSSPELTLITMDEPSYWMNLFRQLRYTWVIKLLSCQH